MPTVTLTADDCGGVMKVAAELAPLRGKYYGTSVSLEIDGANAGAISVWLHGDTGRPSDRELSMLELSKEDWDNNTQIDDGWGGTEPVRESGMWCDSHHETQRAYEVAKFICDAINNANHHPFR